MRWISVVATLGWLICAFGPPSTCPAETAEPIVLETLPGAARPVVLMTINGEGPFRFVVDTGAGGNVVSATLAERLGLETVGTQRIFNPAEGGATDVDVVEVTVAEAGAVRLEHLRLLAANMPQLGGNHGVLGIQSLPQGLLTFDIAGGTIRIENGVLEEDGPGVMPCQLAPVVSVAGEVAGRQVVFHVDTGSPDGITLPGSLARDLTFEAELVTVREQGPLVVQSGRLRGSVRVGSLKLDDPEVQVVDLFPDFGNIGVRFLREQILTIDRDRGLLRLVTPAERSGGSAD